MNGLWERFNSLSLFMLLYQIFISKNFLNFA
nr:MAG TPA: hypothetical protein [Siphoviridae sp. ctngg6]